MNESALQRKITKALQQRGAWVLKTHGGAYQKVGIPDLFVCYRGRFIGFEVKTPQNRKGATDLQIERLKEIRRAGGLAYVIRDVESALKVLEMLDKKRLKKSVDNG